MVAKGTIIKLAVSIELPSGLTMDDIDFQCKFSVMLNSQTCATIRTATLVFLIPMLSGEVRYG